MKPRTATRWPTLGALGLIVAANTGCSQRPDPSSPTPSRLPVAVAAGASQETGPAAGDAVIQALRQIAATPKYEAWLRERTETIKAAWRAVDSLPPRDTSTMPASEVLAAYREAARETLSRLPSYEGQQVLEISIAEFRLGTMTEIDQLNASQLREAVKERLTKSEYNLADANGVLDALVCFPLDLDSLRGPPKQPATLRHAKESPDVESPRTAEDYVRRGEVRLGEKDTPSALADFSQALKLDPRCTRALYGRAVTLARSRDVDGAIADLTELQRVQPRYNETPSEYIGQPAKSEVRELLINAALADLRAMNQLTSLRYFLEHPTPLDAQTPKEAARMIFEEDAEYDRDLREALAGIRQAYMLTEQAWDIVERQFPEDVPAMLGVLGVQRQILINCWPNER